MREYSDVIQEILSTFESKGIAQVPRLLPFKFVRRTDKSIVILREKGTEATVQLSAIEKAIKAIRSDHTVYLGGPSRLREFGITHVNSPVFALVRLLPLNQLIN